MNSKNKTCCFSGPRTERLPKTNEEMRNLADAVYDAIEAAIQDGYDTFLHGACYGFDLMCAEQILIRRCAVKPDDPKQIRVVAAVPFEKQAETWKETDRNLYFDILHQCDDIITISDHYYSGCYFMRNQWMVDRSNRLICYSDGNSRGTADTVRRAQKAGLNIINLYN